MNRILLSTVVVLSVAMSSLAVPAAPLEELKSLDLQIPTSDQLFPGPGADAINNNCLACHSADHVLNQPSLPRQGWEEIVNKMIDSYKAPISSKDAAAIVDYLSRTKGAT
jgi:cytochrome c553